MFVQRCVVVKDGSVKERHFSDNIILLSVIDKIDKTWNFTKNFLSYSDAT